jgi:hypothetical protein
MMVGAHRSDPGESERSPAEPRGPEFGGDHPPRGVSRVLGHEAVRRVVLVTASLLLFFAVLETTLRQTHLLGAARSWTRPNRLLGYEFIPGAGYWCRGGNGLPVPGRINSQGWRDVERTIAKPKGCYRIAVLGDSFVEALQVESDRTFVALSEKLLSSATGRCVEVMNFGRSGYSPAEELLVLREYALKFDLDTVVLFFFAGNDISDLKRETAFDDRRPFFFIQNDGELRLDTSFSQSIGFVFRSIVADLRSRSALVSFVSDRYQPISPSARPTPGLELSRVTSWQSDSSVRWRRRAQERGFPCWWSAAISS